MAAVLLTEPGLKEGSGTETEGEGGKAKSSQKDVGVFVLASGSMAHPKRLV